MEFPSKKKKIYYQGSGIFIKKGGYVDLATIFEIGKTIGQVAAAGNKIHTAASNKKSAEEKSMDFLNEDDDDLRELEEIITKKDKDAAAKLVERMRKLATNEPKKGKGLEYFG
jgi:hypothetical protein